MMLSFIIPCYNEEKRLQKNLPRILAFLKDNVQISKELIIVDDGSEDQTSKMASELLQGSQIQWLIHRLPKNQGKGAAVKKGVELAKGDFILFFDIDISTSLENIHDVIDLMHKNKSPIIIGNRILSESKITNTQNILRRFAGNIYRRMGTFLLGLHVSDVGCGFKCFRADIAKKLFPLLTISRWSFDAELLLLAERKKIPIQEIPVLWKNDPDSRLRLWKDGPKSIFELLQIRYRFLKKNFGEEKK